jgi:hypothetical protein
VVRNFGSQEKKFSKMSRKSRSSSKILSFGNLLPHVWTLSYLGPIFTFYEIQASRKYQNLIQKFVLKEEMDPNGVKFIMSIKIKTSFCVCVWGGGGYSSMWIMSISFCHPNPSSFLKSLSRIKNPFSKKLILRVNVPFQTKSEGPIFVFLTVPMRKTYPFTSLHFTLSLSKRKTMGKAPLIPIGDLHPQPWRALIPLWNHSPQHQRIQFLFWVFNFFISKEYHVGS